MINGVSFPAFNHISLNRGLKWSAIGVLAFSVGVLALRILRRESSKIEPRMIKELEIDPYGEESWPGGYCCNILLQDGRQKDIKLPGPEVLKLILAASEKVKFIHRDGVTNQSIQTPYNDPDRGAPYFTKTYQDARDVSGNVFTPPAAEQILNKNFPKLTLLGHFQNDCQWLYYKVFGHPT